MIPDRYQLGADISQDPNLLCQDCGYIEGLDQGPGLVPLQQAVEAAEEHERTNHA